MNAHRYQSSLTVNGGSQAETGSFESPAGRTELLKIVVIGDAATPIDGRQTSRPHQESRSLTLHC